MFETVTLGRNCNVTMIPSGEKIVLQKGSHVHITQSLGGSFTVMTESGYMARIEGVDADAIGKERSKTVKKNSDKSSSSFEERVWGELQTCFDPEIPVNIVDLGLVYECLITPVPEEPGKNNVHIKMTLTAPGCGMGDSIRMDAIQKIQNLPGAGEVQVDLVWEPQWDRSMMSDAAKLKLGVME